MQQEEKDKFKCAICGTPSLDCCSNCNQVFYCSLQHQKEHWKEHKNQCLNLKQDNLQISGNNIQQQQFGQNRDHQYKNTYVNNHNNLEKNLPNNLNNINNKNNNNFIEFGNNNNNQGQQNQNIQDLINQRKQLRCNIIQLFGTFNYTGCILPAKKLVKISKTIYTIRTKLEELYEYFADWLLLIKCLIKIDKFKSARQNLLMIFEQMNSLLDESRLQMKTQTLQLIKIDNKDLNNQQKLGDLKSCEQAYVKYVKLVESALGPECLETSNCYFLVGVFYLQNKQYMKALACIKKAHNIRITKLTEKNESVSDCQYNIGVIYKQMGKKMKAIEFLDKALVSRRELIGDLSLPVAQCLETLGKVYLEEENYRHALSKFQEAYVIRKKIIQNNQHPDLIRISLLIIHLFNCVKQQLLTQEHNKNTQIMLQNLTEHIHTTVLDQNLQSYVNNDRSQEKINDLLELKQSQFQGYQQNQNNGTLNQTPNKSFSQQMQFQDKMQYNGSQRKTSNDLYNNNNYQNEIQRNKEQEMQLKQLKEEIEMIKQIQNQTINNQQNEETQKNNKESDKEEDYKLNIDDKLMSTLSTNDLIALTELNQEIENQQQLGVDGNQLKLFIINSNFIQNLSSFHIQFDLLKKKNPFIFDYSNPEIKRILDFYENSANIPQIQQSKSLLDIKNNQENNANQSFEEFNNISQGFGGIKKEQSGQDLQQQNQYMNNSNQNFGKQNQFNQQLEGIDPFQDQIIGGQHNKQFYNQKVDNNLNLNFDQINNNNNKNDFSL
ncbi:hypothetical protein PPERSA_02747 [Pseudocohnilembus persalinus]|uniref:MYND-type domain-containing protein n=1 Tax=Pseudocohnilembus persalinus TaxID=266149 RepID=A0A0V0R7M7_PSEPJ|nr:hypothetical protein PPERSA_02747 [Pseudocohnilembus persalinus]|eukprot:KRX10330.1 hypothetical protein PPERSA_02747 [Pseudocohnilembus persalinus]